MALIKRAKPADAIEEEEAEQLEELPEDALPAAAPVAEAPVDADIDDDEQPGDAETMAALAAVPEPTNEGGGDGLLDMFSTVGVHVEDKTMLVGLAGEVDIDDLVSELALVAAALGIVKGQHATAPDEELEELAA
jgi:hypothetical protein